MDSNLEKTDSLFIYLIENSGSLPNFFDRMYNFFLRNTDLFKQPDINKQFIDDKFSFYLKKYNEIQKQIKKTENSDSKENDILKNNVEGLKLKPVSKSDLENLRKAQDTSQAVKLDNENISLNSSNSQQFDNKVFEDEKSIVNNMEPNDGNGGRCKKYFWTQNLAEICISMLVGIKLSSKDIKIKCSSKKLFVGLRDGPTIIDGDLAYPVKCDSLIWTFDPSNASGAKYLNISIEKIDNFNWWDCVIKGDPTIDLSKINCKNPDISHLEPETKAKFEQVMYDQTQIISGKPTSLEIQKRNKFKDFIEANPHLNFDKAKIKDDNDDFHY